ncbi:dihydrolipoyl dehydrogenase family protein [Sphingomonas glacialis]|uniref:Mercuric reductase n=1 Tax=Sphingomonas glacialis TaxID=658225 RepID=A0A502FRA3_9SPHN|nr:FAD-dependent oxidoreductase [Sphingomonas glacialis]TPG52078.1 mercuric reductase [Sphingomonas glacialis]
MVDTEHFDMLILGGGKAGKSLAMDQAKQGRRVAMIEAGLIGGSCINIACIPTKALIRSAERASLVADAAAFGVNAGQASIDMEAVARRTAEVVSGMVGLNQKAFDASGLELVLGWGRFVEPRVIEVEGEGGRRRLTAPRIYLNLGTRAAMPAIPGLKRAVPLTHVEALLLDEVPETLLIIGGGYVGMEMAQAFSRLGSRVVVIHAGLRLGEREDPDVAEEIQKLFDWEGIEVATGARASLVEGRSGGIVSVTVDDGRIFTGSHLLVATGRQPMTSEIGLEIAGVALNGGEFIEVDDTLRTSAPGIWALGEAAGTPMFTHAAFDDFRVAKSQLEGGSRTTADRLIPYCVFLDPEFARVGLNERDAEVAGLHVRVCRLPMDVVPRARTMSARRGFMKCLIGKDDRILGFAMMGERAGEVVATVQLAMLAGAPYTLLRDAILAHPTMTEGLNLLFAGVPQLRD